MNPKDLGKKIQQAREEKNMSQEELAMAIGCSQSAFSNYEKGKRHIYLAQLEKLSAALEKPLDYFVEDKPPEENKLAANRGPDDQFINLMNEIYKLSDTHIREVVSFVAYLNWKQSQEDQ